MTIWVQYCFIIRLVKAACARHVLVVGKKTFQQLRSILNFICITKQRYESFDFQKIYRFTLIKRDINFKNFDNYVVKI